MKKMTYLLASVLSITLLASCGGDQGKEKAVLQARIDSLIQVNAALTANGAGRLKVKVPRSEPINPQTAASYTSTFRNISASDIKIPAAFAFDADDLVFLANASGDETSTGSVRFYSALKPQSGGLYEMTLVAVPTDNTGDGNDVFTYQGQNTVYDFAAPCPTKCDNNNSMLSTPPALAKYHKFKRMP